MKRLILLLGLLSLIACGEPEPRRPIKSSGGSFLKESVERNKQLLALEETRIKEIIAMDSTNVYLASGNGSWYFYKNRNEEGILAEPEDLVTLSYDILTLENDTIYSMEEIGVIQYKVDKQELFPGLRNSVKLLRENEIATFLYTSPMAYGYLGDKARIGPNVPVKTTIQILNIEKSKDQIDE
ncbi:MAG: gliding motility-associated peptidyl-prolyl isomerase GldI [Eudoraea sp.]|nr:gliding motility-associated peptidyl-prolyl isomerase GldI [Eudoraea sp.]MBT8211276.1 gliding motility-associated peptidyl-prolyl isomerase GldI [Eudoraea sp.]MBT8312607.1 gliding motility-associated peptidyl-prolyl isomerase GldI [Eudoraea sp.]NNJ39022.1 gliding motility-associated peptidyl-prolyl isomerase GldI [Flavobacteriaceae bacterium]